MTYPQWERLQTFVGQARRKVVEKIVDAPKWDQIGDGDKIRVLSEAYRVGLEAGTEMFKRDLVQRGETLEKQSLKIGQKRTPK